MFSTSAKAGSIIICSPTELLATSHPGYMHMLLFDLGPLFFHVETYSGSERCHLASTTWDRHRQLLLAISDPKCCCKTLLTVCQHAEVVISGLHPVAQYTRATSLASVMAGHDLPFLR